MEQKQPTNIGATGDTVIHPSGLRSNNQKPNKRVIVGVILAAMITIVTIIIVVALGSINNGSKPSTTIKKEELSDGVSVDAAEKFDTYANYILSGKASAERISSDNEENAVIISKILDRDTNFMSQAKKYYNDFYNEVINSEGDNAELLDFAINYKSTFDFLDGYMSLPEINDQELRNSAKKEGVAAVEAKIDNFFTPLLELDSVDATEYAKNTVAYYKAIINKQSDATEFNRRASDALFNAYDKIVSECYDINALIFGGKNQ